MSFALLLPAATAALIALLLPLLIHLVRRSERKPTDFAALRWLQAQARPRRYVRFDEWLLLALRLLLVALLALLLARPVLYGAPDEAPWVVAAPGVAAETLRGFDAPQHAQRRWLAPGFPEGDAAPPEGGIAFGSLLRELDATLPAGATLTVLVPETIDGADAERPRLSRRVDWRVIAAQRSASAAHDEAKGAPAPTLVVRHAPEREPALRYFRAAAEAWRVNAAAPSASGTRGAQDMPAAESTLDIADIAQPLPEDAAWLVWLAPGPLPEAIIDWIAAGGIALLDPTARFPGLDTAPVLWRDDNSGEPLARGITHGRGRVLQFTRAPMPAELPVLLEGEFPRRLHALFAPPPAPARAAASAYTPLTGAAPWPEQPRELSPWLLWLIAVLFAAERWCASTRRRVTA